MAKHPRNVEGFEGSLEQLAKTVGDMAYDQTASFIEKLADDIKGQADNDKSKGRVKLASRLYAVAEQLYKARDEMELAWKICEHYMKD